MAHHVEGDVEMVHVIQIEATDGQAPPPEATDGQAPAEVIEPRIFRVHDGLRKSNPDAYTPMLISIGPYHRGKGKLKAMEVHKKRYLRSFVARGEHSEDSYKETLKGLKTKARAYYADPIGPDDDEEFVDMLLLDGSFIVEFVRKSLEVGPKAIDEPIFNVDLIRNQVYLDLLLFENQLPYFVIAKLYDMTKDPNTTFHSFREMVEETFARVLPKLCPTPIFHFGLGDSREIKHLLHVMHILCQLPLRDEGSSSELPDQIRCVTELQEAGVRFKKPETESDGSLFNTEFDNGEFKIPSFNIDHLTESLFRNFIAYEQLSYVYPKNFSDYANIMDQLINSGRDVSVLRLEGIVTNWLGRDEEAAQLFNKLCHGVVPPRSYHFYYSGLCKKVNEHCNIPYNVRMAKLRHDYFSGPWAGLSTAAAIVLLLLTIAQTVANFLAF